MMWPPNRSIAVWLYRRPTDMRKSFDGLALIVDKEIGQNPQSGSLYCFINRQIPCLYECPSAFAWNNFYKMLKWKWFIPKSWAM